MDAPTPTLGCKGFKGTPIGPTPTSPTPIPPIGTPPGPPSPIGTPTSSASTTTSCYQYPLSPIDNLMGGVDMNDDGESNEFETNRSTDSMLVRGGRPPRPKKKRTRNVANKSIVWEHFTKNVDSLEEDPVAHCNYCEAPYNCNTINYGTSNILYHFRICQK
jgi:hypothetical protein